MRTESPTTAIVLGPSSLWLDSDGVARVDVARGARLEAEHAEELLSALGALCHGGPTPLVSDIRGLCAASREFRERMAGEQAERLICASALIVDTPVSKVIGAFFLRLNAQLYPTRIYTDEDAASCWARDFL